MNGQELPPFHAEAPVAETATQEVQAELLRTETSEKLHLLRDTLYEQRRPDVMSYTFSFYGEALDNDSVYIPDAVHRLASDYGELDSIEVQCSYLADSGGTSFDIYFEFYNDDEESDSVCLHVERPYNYKPHVNSVDRVYPDRDEEFIERNVLEKVAAVPPRELSRCLTSLIYNSPNTTPSVLDAFDWSAKDFDKTTDHFKDVANYYSGNHEYILTDSLGGPAGSLSYETVKGDVTDVRLYRVDKLEIDWSPGGNLGYVEKAIITTLEAGGNVYSYEYNVIDDDDYSNDIEINYSAEHGFIDEQIALLNPLPLN